MSSCACVLFGWAFLMTSVRCLTWDLVGSGASLWAQPMLRRSRKRSSQPASQPASLTNRRKKSTSYGHPALVELGEKNPPKTPKSLSPSNQASTLSIFLGITLSLFSWPPFTYPCRKKNEKLVCLEQICSFFFCYNERCSISRTRAEPQWIVGTSLLYHVQHPVQFKSSTKDSIRRTV